MASIETTAGNLSLPKASSQGVVARRINFLPQLPAGIKALREFCQPRTCHAVVECVDADGLGQQASWPEPTDHLLVLFIPLTAGAEWQRFGEDWLAPPPHPEAPQTAEVQGRGRKVEWRPGRAVVRGYHDLPEDVFAALVDFAFYEGELRNLEFALKMAESGVQEDVGRAYRIRARDKKYWPRFAERIEYFSRLRLVYASLEPRLLKGSRTLPGIPRRWVKRLFTQADAESRLEEVNERLEACEYLYEGANDRVADYRGYHLGHILEITIVAFLVVEVVLMIAEIVLLIHVADNE